MPELPEVETIRLGLQKKIIGLTLKKVELLTPKSFQGDPKEIEGKKIVSLWRRAKILGIQIAMSPAASRNDIVLLIHLKMSGQLVFDDPARSATQSVAGGGKRFIGGHPTLDMRDQMPNRSTRVVFTFNDGSKLYFNDQRRFGWIKVVTSTDVTSNKFLAKLGPEPLEKEFTWQILKQNLLKHKTLPIKVALLDQSIVSGIGNIYSSEACFNAKINPKTKVSNLSDLQFKKLHLGILKSLRDGIKYGGSTKTNFVDAQGHKGYFLDYAYVYWRDKHPCRICKTIIEKFQLRGRGTYWCTSCQKE